MHDALTISIPLVAIIAGILFNRADASDLRKEIRELRTEMHREFREFYRTIGQHDARLDSIEKRQA